MPECLMNNYQSNLHSIVNLTKWPKSSRKKISHLLDRVAYFKFSLSPLNKTIKSKHRVYIQKGTDITLRYDGESYDFPCEGLVKYSHDFSPAPFLAWGDFHARSCFTRSTIPEEIWGTTSSLFCRSLLSAILFIKFTIYSGFTAFKIVKKKTTTTTRRKLLKHELHLDFERILDGLSEI